MERNMDSGIAHGQAIIDLANATQAYQQRDMMKDVPCPLERICADSYLNKMGSESQCPMKDAMEKGEMTPETMKLISTTITDFVIFEADRRGDR